MIRKILMITAVMIAGAGPAAAQVVALGTNPQGTLFYNMGAAIAKVVSEKTGLQMRVLPIGGTSQLMPLIGRGETEFGLFSAVDMVDGFEGKGSYPDKPVENLRAVAALGPLYFSLFVRNDSPAKTIADTKAMRIPSGFPAALVVLRATKGLLANPGYTMNDYAQQPVANLSQAMEAFKSGRVDVGISSIGAAALRELNTEISGGIRYLPISSEPDAVARMQKEVAVSYPALVRPSPTYVGVREPITVMAFDIYLATRDATSPDLVAKFAATLHAHKDDLVSSFPGFRSFEPAQMVKEFPVPFHPGALRFYSEKGLRPAR